MNIGKKKGLASVETAINKASTVRAKVSTSVKPVTEVHEKYGPMLILNPDAQFKFQFGPNKAKMILDNISEIQKFAGALQGQRATKGIFITTGFFSEEVPKLVEGPPLELINGQRLRQILGEYRVSLA